MASKDNQKVISKATGKVGKDKDGRYEIWENCVEVPCGCHPETCGHRNGTAHRTFEWKKYIDKYLTTKIIRDDY
jgi:hypothetical protein